MEFYLNLAVKVHKPGLPVNNILPFNNWTKAELRCSQQMLSRSRTSWRTFMVRSPRILHLWSSFNFWSSVFNHEQLSVVSDQAGTQADWRRFKSKAAPVCWRQWSSELRAAINKLTRQKVLTHFRNTICSFDSLKTVLFQARSATCHAECGVGKWACEVQL